jgi:hemerythrin-like domain-containing protein
MKPIPNVDQYSDPIQFLRAMHVAILDRATALENLVRASQKSDPRFDDPLWSELLHFFRRVLPVHEKDEEQSLFPVLMKKLPHVGFQPRNSPTDFILTGHDVMNEHAESLVVLWHLYMDKGAAVYSGVSAKPFFETALELIALVRDHIELEGREVYANANDLLTPEERYAIMEKIKQRHQSSVEMPMPAYDTSTSSMQVSYTMEDPVDLVSESTLPIEQEADDDEEETEDRA